ncbi:protein TIFY 8 isoform X2 [Populus trichocarpa]|uniref:protein TIFY 8 isoform X2 n=1 Tax=Populus trichocarpa TaxID=3694 RepID=UPI000D18A3B6|nr:protein TIFY 8 isoform X2 [Populus trichocarpa]|eukprot:XP_024460136.1 protein TIFY 8 isoform X2 [Populus trichocarpa]
MAVVLTMAQQSKNNNANSSHNNSVYVNNSTATSQQQQKQDLKAMFHDFLGMKGTTDSPVVLAPKNKDGSPSASASLGASSGGGRGPLSSTSDLASERQAGNHLEGIPFYGPRSDISGPEISNRLAGSKRSNSDSAFTGSRDGIPQMAHDSIESLHLMKMLKNGGGRERPRRSNDDEVFYGMQPMRPSSASLILQPSAGSRLDANVSKQDRSIPMGIGAYPPRGGQFVPFTHQVPTNRFRDTNAGPSIVSQSAADEGSRTGIKGPGILSSINAGSGISEKNSSRGLPSGGKPKTGIHISEPESSNPSSRQGLTSASRQMTIFYGGQAHVFDDVHPNKMARYTSRLELRVDLVEYMLKVAEFSFELIYHIQWQENVTELQTDA